MRLAHSYPVLLAVAALTSPAAERLQIANGKLQGVVAQASGVRMFKGIPFAQPPVGDLRWREPLGVKNWKGVRKADHFAAQCMQLPVFHDMVFRSAGMSEDCLYLNVWTPAKSAAENLPVLVYFYGGGFRGGDGSEYRYDGESMASKGIVSVTVNYRLGAFGFFAHPELTKESPHHASGNYGLLDQSAAIHWVKQNIAFFGGDPGRITIAGESAGSTSVSAQMASPLSKNLIAAAIGESGSILGTLSAVPLDEAEQRGVKFAGALGANSLAALRALPADKILQQKEPRFTPTVDGYFLAETPATTFEQGKQAHVPLLVGWNSEEGNWRGILHNTEPTPENYRAAVAKLYPEHEDAVLTLYPGATKDEVIESGTALASDRFIGLSTWRWSHECEKTGGKPVYRYHYEHPRPAMTPEGEKIEAADGPLIKHDGAVHSSEIEYALGNLSTNKAYVWTADDYKVSKTMQEYFANFIKKFDPNGPGLSEWPANSGNSVSVMHINVDPHASPAEQEDRYKQMERLEE